MYKARKWYGFSSLDIYGYNFLQKVRAPDGYPFFIVDLPQPVDSDPVVSVGIIAIKMSHKLQMFSQVAISASSPTRSLTFWASQLGLELLSGSPGSTSLRFPGGAALVLVATPSGAPVDHAKAAGFYPMGGSPFFTNIGRHHRLKIFRANCILLPCS